MLVLDHEGKQVQRYSIYNCSMLSGRASKSATDEWVRSSPVTAFTPAPNVCHTIASNLASRALAYRGRLRGPRT